MATIALQELREEAEKCFEGEVGQIQQLNQVGLSQCTSYRKLTEFNDCCNVVTDKTLLGKLFSPSVAMTQSYQFVELILLSRKW